MLLFLELDKRELKRYLTDKAFPADELDVNKSSCTESNFFLHHTLH